MGSRDTSLSPARKRMRLSSPTYDEQIGDLSQDDIQAIDAFEAILSQQPISSTTKRINTSAEQFLSQRSDDNPFASQGGPIGFVSAASANDHGTTVDASPTQLLFHKASSMLPAPAFQTAASLRDTSPFHDPPSHSGPSAAGLQFTPFQSASTLKHTFKDTGSRSPSPEVPPEMDHSAWFDSGPLPAVTGFRSANSTVSGFSSASALATGTPAGLSTGFTSAKGKGIMAPSEEALRKAQQKMKQWQEEQDCDNLDENVPSPEIPVATPLRASQAPFSSARMVPLAAVPDTPTPIRSHPGKSTQSLSMGASIPGNPKPFRSPLIKAAVARPGHVSSLLNPTLKGGFASASSFSLPPSTPIRPASAALVQNIPPSTSADRTLGLTPRNARGTPARKFVTPFKQGLHSGQPGRAVLEAKNVNMGIASSQHTPLKAPRFKPPPFTPVKHVDAPKTPVKAMRKIFDLTPIPDRKSLASSQLQPQKYTVGDYEDMGVDIAGLSQITPETALFYSFHNPECSTTGAEEDLSLSSEEQVGYEAALRELHVRGCSLATKEWVKNHWSLILWKVAGMVALDPETEANPHKKRWCWPEIIRQLMYKYERDLNSASRPALRLITTQDAPAALPMVLCVSAIIWPERTRDESGLLTEGEPELELTDGWYRLRAPLDGPLARAVRKGKIRVGRKLAISGARLSSEKKEPCEILEAYSSNTLIISGNSTHLAPWHAKLGFCGGMHLFSLNSLTADGGAVAAMTMEVVKAYPVAYIESLEDEQGRKRSSGVMNGKEENAVRERWKAKREREASKLWDAHRRQQDLRLTYAERLEQKAGPQFNPRGDDSPPDSIDSLYDSLLEDAQAAKGVLSSASRSEAGWLARHLRNAYKREDDLAPEEIERELRSLCPPRDVRNFRIVVMRDARTERRPANRTAQVTVWDVLSLSTSEGSNSGTFTPGQKFLVTNLFPSQPSAWMGCEPGAEIFLTTRKNTRWRNIPSSSRK